MTVKRLGTFTCYFTSGAEQKCKSLDEAQAVAAEYCGNTSYNKPFPRENTYLYGPGDGTTSVMIREDVEYV